MKLTKEECEKALDILKEQHDYLSFNLHSNYPYSIEMIKRVQNCFEQLIEEHFKSSECRVESSLTRDKNLVSNLVSEVDKLDKEIDKLEKTLKEIREQCASAMDEVQALRNENEMLKRRNVGLEQTISNQNKKLHSYYMAMVTNKE